MEDTIAAISTPPGEGAVAMVRISGPEARPLAGSLIRRPGGGHFEWKHGRQAPAVLADENGVTIDFVMVSSFFAPRSYTGEDLVEITCHGGPLVTGCVLAATLKAGARPAGPGEFTIRAFGNGKIDLTRAEAVMDLIRARSELALRSAREQLNGALGDRILALRDSLLGTLAQIEAHIDFPEEDIDPASAEQIHDGLGGILAGVRALLDTADRGRILREGVRTVIFGKPNVGKSSLLNRMLGYDRAIVSPTPGTTRDMLEEQVKIGGVVLRLEDTAGLRSSTDQIECMGIERTQRALENADLKLHVHDATLPAPESPDGHGERKILVLNKCDLPVHPSWEETRGVRISCLDKRGMGDLEAAIIAAVDAGQLGGADSAVAINARHQNCLQRTAGSLEMARAALAAPEPPEIIALDLREALEALGDIVGRTDTEDLLTEIFSKFCIGK